ncbi:MAG: hypothetical protein NC308_09090 [Clostridium sp.]|nr:hypothetical protein [Bacteroides sp.]MCM1199030.1 hypothetical protein [Clostridium sp.]
MKILKKDTGYKWEFENIGGSTRVKITSGEDIAHLHELDRKMWTVLSCPVKGLEIDERSLSYMDWEQDGKIHLDDVVHTADWITGALKDNDLLLRGDSSIDIRYLDTGNATGKKIYSSARQILKNLGKETDVISISDIADSSAIFAKTRFNGDGIITEASADTTEEKSAILAAIATVGQATDRSGAPGITAEIIGTFYKSLTEYAAWIDSAPEAPFGEKTDAALAAYNALDAKVRDFFMRSRLAAFAPDSTSALDVQKSRIESISAEDLNGKTAEIASYPIARITGRPEIDLNDPVNPAWAADFQTLKSIAMDSGMTVLTETGWNAIGEKFAAYTAWKAAKAGSAVEPLGNDNIRELILQDRQEALLNLVAKDIELKEEAENIELVDKFLHIYRDFYTLLKNFVTFQDFYNPDKDVRAIFQAGTLIIDQRACRLCINVTDAAKHGIMAPSSGMYLLYCDCVTKTVPGVKQIVAAVTVGDIGDLSVGKNAIFYDNNGLDWDATVTKIIENPISISQAFWSPYRRMAQTVENFINKSAAEKDAKIMAEANKKITAAPAPGTADANAAAQPPFDIAKFAGIFAAFGMALGMIGTFLASLAKGVLTLTWWQAILVFIGIILIISGPSMVMAWMKLRRRNIAPLLNANGWAINASSNISIPFGATLTDIVKFPKLKLKDPYAKKGMATWKKWCISAGCIAAVAIALWLCNLLAWASLPSPIFGQKEVTESAAVPAEAVQEVEATIEIQE